MMRDKIDCEELRKKMMIKMLDEKLNVRELCEKIGISRNTYYRLLNNCKPSYETYFRVFDYVYEVEE